jgi:hypothetical protein
LPKLFKNLANASAGSKNSNEHLSRLGSGALFHHSYFIIFI